MHLSQCIHTFELDSATANHLSIGICHVCGVVMSNGVNWTFWESMTNNVVIGTGWPVDNFRMNTGMVDTAPLIIWLL
jgi:hypothetical protein